MTRPLAEGAASQGVTPPRVSLSQLAALEALIGRRDGETLEGVAGRAGVTRRTLHRYLQKPDFVGEYRRLIEAELGGARAKVAAALVRGAVTPGHGQAAMQRIYWQRLGELQEGVHRHQHEHSGRVVITPEVARSMTDEELELALHRAQREAETAEGPPPL